MSINILDAGLAGWGWLCPGLSPGGGGVAERLTLGLLVSAAGQKAGDMTAAQSVWKGQIYSWL